MLFNSIEFILFLPIVFVLYWFVFHKELRLQNLLILVSSYIFYGWWDYRFLALIFLSTLVDYGIGLAMAKQTVKKRRQLLLWCSVLFNLGILGFFKYFNFFVESWVAMLGNMGYGVKSVWTLNIILPVGISFYTFQTMSYTIDIYQKKLQPTNDFISFASFVSFFPQLVAGPIERATNLMPQMLNKRKFEYAQAVQGLRLILWGMFKKVVIADSLAPFVNDIFGNYQDYGGATLGLGAVYFAFQIYCDFSGYSDIAIGTAKLFGFDLMTNFKFPYFSRNIGEFWRRWHISLSTWFRDYLYIPLGGSRVGKWKSVRNIFIIFTVSGFWHGANWTFIAWGLFHAFLFLPSFILNTNRKYTGGSVMAQNGLLPSLGDLPQIILTFLLVTIGWVFFRCAGIGESFAFLGKIFFGFFDQNNVMLLSNSGLKMAEFISINLLLFGFLVFEWRYQKTTMPYPSKTYPSANYVFYMVLALIIMVFGNTGSEFIYFRF